MYPSGEANQLFTHARSRLNVRRTRYRQTAPAWEPTIQTVSVGQGLARQCALYGSSPRRKSKYRYPSWMARRTKAK